MIQWLLDRLDISHITANLRRRGWTAVPPSGNPCKEIPLPRASVPFMQIKPLHQHSEPERSKFWFPNHPVIPTKERVFDDLDLARGKVPYRSAEWYAIREKLVASLKSPGRAFVSPHSKCHGCNEDDRGFVTVIGCPVHDNDEYRAWRAKAEEDLKVAQKMQAMLPLKRSPSDDGVSGE